MGERTSLPSVAELGGAEGGEYPSKIFWDPLKTFIEFYLLIEFSLLCEIKSIIWELLSAIFFKGGALSQKTFRTF